MWRFLRRAGLLFWRALGLRCPNSKTLFLAFDLTFRPTTPEELRPVGIREPS